MAVNFIKLTWAETGRERWVATNHIIWIAKPPFGGDGGASVFVTGDGVAESDWLAVNESPEAIMEAIAQVEKKS